MTFVTFSQLSSICNTCYFKFASSSVVCSCFVQNYLSFCIFYGCSVNASNLRSFIIIILLRHYFFLSSLSTNNYFYSNTKSYIRYVSTVSSTNQEKPKYCQCSLHAPMVHAYWYISTALIS